MKRLLAALLLCCLPLAAGVIIKNPYTTDGNWYIGQLHFHTKYDAGTNTTGSDGTKTPAEMETAYHNAGYDFVISTDHRSATYTGGGMTADPAGTDLLWILGTEIDTTQGHLNCLGIDTNVQVPWSAPTAAQTEIDEARTNAGITQVNHPVTYAAWTWWAELEPIKRLSLIEVINGGNMPLSDWGPGIDLADEYRSVWWTSNDDAHNATTALNKYCVVVQTASASIAEADILSSLDSGNFYMRQTATGPTITSVGVSGSTITLTMPSGAYTVTWYKKGKRTLRTDTGVTTTASYTAVGTEGWVSAEISDGSKSSWTQPLFVINDADLSNAAAASAGTAANLIDNNQGTTCDFGAATGNFTIDLGAAKQANGIRIYWNCAGTERWNYKIEESTTGAFGGEETEIIRTTFSNRASTTLDVFDCWTRYIKVTITGASVGSSNASVKEVEVFNASPEITEYYINNISGNDANTGTIDAPFQTSNNAQLILRPRDRLNFVNSGTAYGLIRPDTVNVDAHYGKHAGAYCYFRGLSFPALTSNARGFHVNDADIHYVHFSGFNVTGCTVAPAIDVTLGSDVIIYGNLINNSAQQGIYLSSSATNITIAYNSFWTCGKVGSKPTIEDSLNAGGVAYIYNNSLYDGYRGIWVNKAAASVVTVKNNITDTMSNSQGLLKTDASAGTVTDSNNCNSTGYYGTWAKTNNKDVDPKFVGAASGNLRLKQTSTLLRSGASLGLTADVAGNTVPAWTGKAPDIGAYENRPGGVFIF